MQISGVLSLGCFFLSVTASVTVALSSSNLNLSVLSSVRLPDTPPPLLSGNCLWSENQGNQRPELVCFPSFTDHNPILPVFQYLKIIVQETLSSFLLFMVKGNLGPLFPPGLRQSQQLDSGTC